MNSATDFKPATQASRERQYMCGEPWGKQHSLLIHAGIFLAMACVLVADLYTPLGMAVWVMYLVPVILSLIQWNPRVPIFVAAISTLLMILTFVTGTVGSGIGIAGLNRGFGIMTIWIMAIMGYFFIRNRTQVNHQQWLQYGRSGLNDILSGELQLHQSGEDALAYLARFLNAQAGVLYIWQDDCFRRIAAYGVPATMQIPETFTSGDGLLGQAALEARSFLVENVPQGYLRIGSALGEGAPRSLVIAPMKLDGKTTTVLELGFLHVVGKRETALLDEVSVPLCKALRAAKYRQHLQQLLEETRLQADELQAQGEELRMSNEELEEQSLSLQHSYEHLEKQQMILEQSNVQLEKQTLQLEHQRDDLTHARAAIELKAQELERVSQYKTDFLANMSHELRTPLNSSLILARLLADNSEQNLTHEQVAAAETIVAAGNDLLALINDILDLSRIEAGRMEIHSEPVWLAQLVKNLANAMRPQADHKGLDFAVSLAPDCPETICTDYQRLEQVLRNLLSNAIKFTEEGCVTVDVSPAAEGYIAFAVTDTGIGIPEEQHQTVFEAFHQIDSAANRKYSGTGLGLSISKELTRLLGGEIALSSKLDAGSTFTLLLPLAWEPPLLLRQPNRRIVTSQAYIDRPTLERRRKAPIPVMPVRHACDDRARLDGHSRVILIVEDDEVFAGLLGELVHEQDFQCLVAVTSDEAIEMAQQYLPSAVLLDIGLPDHSGLTVLDRLKVDSYTRHIPVHVISGSDHAEAAMALGAIGYMQKPASREMLIEALRNLETRLVQHMRRVLLVEEDPDQLDNLRRMLASQEVETIAVTTAAECLQQLRDTTFDCLVLDLSLPKASGYALLDALSREETYAFPPVIAYTGRELPEEDEQRLRAYACSMLIKGARSPENLLDEVTLFLHQVVADLPPDQQRMIQRARNRETALEKRRILIVEDDVRNVFALSSLLEPWGAIVQIARNGREALEVLAGNEREGLRTDLVLMDVMMPEMDGITATREIRKRAEWKNLPIIMLTAKAMHDDQESCFAAGANDYMAKPLDVDKLLSLVRVWIRR